MKKIFRIIIVATIGFFSLSHTSFSQMDINRTTSTKIVDALAQLPAQKESTYQNIIADIISTGDEGLNMLMEMLNKNDESIVPVEYAISGLVNVASSNDFDVAQREAIKRTIKTNVDKAKDPSIKEFLIRQLMILGDEYGNIVTTESEMDAPIAIPTVKEFSSVFKNKKATREDRFDVLYRINNPSDYYETINKYLRKAKKYDAVVDLLWWLGEQKDDTNADIILPFLYSENIAVCQEAAWALAKIGRQKDINDIASLLTKNDGIHEEIATNVLKSYKGDVVDIAVKLFDNASSKGKAGILSLISQRHSFKNMPLVKESLNNSDKIVRESAFQALANVVASSDINYLYNLLESCQKEEVENVQNAIIAAFGDEDKSDIYSALTKRKDVVAANKQSLYWPMIISNASTNDVFDICKETSDDALFEQAFRTYINNIRQSDEPGAQKLLRLRAIMPYTRSTAQKKAVLDQVGNTNTFLGMIFAGDYLDIPELQQEAAKAIRIIGTANPQFTGKEIISLLTKTMSVIKGADADYEITAVRKHLDELPNEEGFVSMFNGKNLDGWKGLVEDPITRGKMKTKDLEKAQIKADAQMAKDWVVNNGCIEYVGTGFDNLCTTKEYGDFEMYVDWMLYPGEEPDAGIYLRGTPQVQIWDISRTNVGAEVGSGGLYNNKVNRSTPLVVADNRLGEWNSFYIKMVGERVTVYLNGVLVTDNIIMENYWNRNIPIFAKEQIELQAHGSKVAYRNLYIKELPSVEPITLSKEEAADGYELLFDGTNLFKWMGNKTDYMVENGLLAVHSENQGDGGDLYTVDEYGDFILRFEFKLTAGANNGVGIRAPGYGDAAYEGMEIQVLDHYDAIYQPWLSDYQYHGSVYGIIPAQRRDALKPVGEWNSEEIYAKGSHIRVTVNGIVVTEGDIVEATKNGTYDHREHPGLFRKSGHIGFLGHGDELWYRNVRVKRLDK